jgi:hypothetical protein
MKNVLGKICRESLNTNFTFNNFFSENRAIYEITWNMFAERGRPEMTMRRMRIASWIPKGYKKTLEMCNSTCFSRQQWLYERVSMLRYTYIVSH